MRIYTLDGVSPETQAYALAKYSRSAQSLRESVAEISAQKTADFLQTFYFQYGHRSIADLAHIVMAIEDVSLLAAIEVADESLWDGQERSTRYQNFRRSGFVVPTELRSTPFEARYTEAADRLFTSYTTLARRLADLLAQEYPPPKNMDPEHYHRTLRARGYDVARMLLPLATRTSLGQITSARTLESQISRLLASPFAEVREIGQAMREACLQPAENPVLQTQRNQLAAIQEAVTRLRERVASLHEELGDLQANEQLRTSADALGVLAGVCDHAPKAADFAAVQDLIATLSADLTSPAAAPTLVKYCQPETHGATTFAQLQSRARDLLAKLAPPDTRKEVDLVTEGDTRDELLATLLYRADDAGHGYRQILDLVRTLSPGLRQAILSLAVAHRGDHDELLREQRSGYHLNFDLLLNLGAYRDLHRHRRCVQVRQPFHTWHQYDDPEGVFLAGLGVRCTEAAARAGLLDEYRRTLDLAGEAAGEIDAAFPGLGVYLWPLAFRIRVLFKVDFAEAAYISELRSKRSGHFSYRRVAYGMFSELAARYPDLARDLRVVEPSDFDLFDR